MNVFEFIARVIQHLDPITLHTRYYGVYSNIIRHKWKGQGLKPNIQSKGTARKDFKISWRKLIWKIYEVDLMNRMFECHHQHRDVRLDDDLLFALVAVRRCLWVQLLL